MTFRAKKISVGHVTKSCRKAMRLGVFFPGVAVRLDPGLIDLLVSGVAVFCLFPPRKRFKTVVRLFCSPTRNVVANPFLLFEANSVPVHSPGVIGE